MKHLKTYEKTIFYQRDKNQKFEVGDKVFIIPDESYTDDFSEFLINNIGTIYSMYQRTIGGNEYRYSIQYEQKIPKNIKNYMERDNNEKRTLLNYIETSQLKMATPFDIELFNIRKTAKNYNL